VLLAKTLRSSTLRLALLAIAIFGAAVIGLFSYVYLSTASFVRGRADRAIAAEQTSLLHVYESAGRQGLIAAVEQRVAEQSLAGGQYLLVDAAGGRLAGNLAAWPAARPEANWWGKFAAPERMGQGGAPFVRTRITTLSDGSRLLVGQAIDDLDAFARTIETALLLGIALIFVLAGVASVSVTRRTVGRIEAINATSRAIMQSGLGERIPMRGTRDEWDQLAANLNSMLDRIEGLMAQVKQVTDNVAHDLRTPLARMRGRLEKAYSAEGATEHERALIGDTLADLEGVLRMFSSLTRISQIEANGRTDACRPVDLAEIAREVTELFDAAAEDTGSRLAVTGDEAVRVVGDRDLLFDALANLVDNAIKHGRDGGHVTVAVSQRGGGGDICVADDGPGIPISEREHVFKRFYRLEGSRRTPGNGLGLSLVAAVARLHGAQIEMEDNEPGLRVRLRFPPAAAAQM
jgi:signal transduction histidine kinase